MIHSRKVKCSSHRTEIKAFVVEMTIKKNRQTFFIYPWRKIHGICHWRKKKKKGENKTAQQKNQQKNCLCMLNSHCQYLAWQPHYTCHRASKSVAIAFLQKVRMNFLATGRPRVTSLDLPDVFWCSHSSTTGSWTAICPVCYSQDTVKLFICWCLETLTCDVPACSLPTAPVICF